MKFLVNILITDAYTIYNKGDAAIILGMLKTIRKFFPNAEITILSGTPEEDSKYFSPYGAKTYSRLFNLIGKNKSKISSFFMLLLKMTLALIWIKSSSIPIPKNDKFILELYKNSDIVVPCGGGYLGGKKYSPVIGSLFPMFIATKLKKKVFVYSQSIEPFQSKFVKFFTKFVLNRVDLITLRESYSDQVLKSINVKTPIYLTADPAFLIDNESETIARDLLKKEGWKNFLGPKIGLTVRKLNSLGIGNKEKIFQNYVKAISQFIEKIILEKNWYVILFSQVIFGPNDDDRILSSQIKAELPHKVQERVLVLKGNYHPEVLKAMMGQMDFFVGTRMHSNIFAISMLVPTIAISYEKKTDGIMEMMNLENYVVNISSLSVNQLMEKVNLLEKNKDEIKKIIEEKLPIIQKKALKNGEFMTRLLSDQTLP